MHPKRDTKTLAFNLPIADIEALKVIAEAYGCIYGGKPCISKLMRKILKGEIALVRVK